MDQHSKKIIIIVPVYNEEGNLEPLHKRLTDVMQQFSYHYEFLFVDDGSCDNSWVVLQRLSRMDPHVKALALSRNFGHQAALSAGLDHAQADAIIMMDADLQHPPELIPEIVKKWEEGFDVVYTIREDSKDSPWFKRMMSSGFYYLFNKLSKSNLPQGVADFRLISKHVAESLSHLKERTRFLRGLIGWVGYRSIGIPYQADTRFSGHSKYSLFKRIRLALGGISSFSTLPLYFAVIFGASISLLSFIYAMYAVYVRIFTQQVVPGWTSILVSVLFLGGIQLLAIGIVGEYLAKVYEEVKARPMYIIRDRLGE